MTIYLSISYRTSNNNFFSKFFIKRSFLNKQFLLINYTRLLLHWKVYVKKKHKMNKQKTKF